MQEENTTTDTTTNLDQREAKIIINGRPATDQEYDRIMYHPRRVIFSEEAIKRDLARYQARPFRLMR